MYNTDFITSSTSVHSGYTDECQHSTFRLFDGLQIPASRTTRIFKASLKSQQSFGKARQQSRFIVISDATISNLHFLLHHHRPFQEDHLHHHCHLRHPVNSNTTAKQQAYYLLMQKLKLNFLHVFSPLSLIKTNAKCTRDNSEL